MHNPRLSHNFVEMKTIDCATTASATPTGQHYLKPYVCPYQHHCA